MSTALRAVAHAYRSEMVATIAFGVTIALGVAGAAFAIAGYTLTAVAFAGMAVATACACIAGFQAAHRWRQLADDIEREAGW